MLSTRGQIYRTDCVTEAKFEEKLPKERAQCGVQDVRKSTYLESWIFWTCSTVSHDRNAEPKSSYTPSSNFERCFVSNGTVRVSFEPFVALKILALVCSHEPGSSSRTPPLVEWQTIVPPSLLLKCLTFSSNRFHNANSVHGQSKWKYPSRLRKLEHKHKYFTTATRI